jgi:protein-L-isoaspartate(D-aspartate) O-methyltransferase
MFILLELIKIKNFNIIMVDNYRHQGLRRKLVENIRNKGISDENVLEAINLVPRHFFMDSSFIDFAYEDKAFPIDAGQTISQPYTVAFQTELLNVKKGDKILEIGTGSGYQTAVLCVLGTKVFTIERQKILYDKVKTFLPSIGYKAQFFYGDGYLGLPTYAPFDKILVTAGATVIPEELLKQLKIGGRLVIPLGDNKIQKMVTIDKLSNDKFDRNEFGVFRFVPLLRNKAK